MVSARTRPTRFTITFTGDRHVQRQPAAAALRVQHLRLFLDPNESCSGIPGYYDYARQRSAAAGEGGNVLNFYAYFSAYGNGSYDANDVNFASEADPTRLSPIALTFQYGITLTHRPRPIRIRRP